MLFITLIILPKTVKARSRRNMNRKSQTRIIRLKVSETMRGLPKLADDVASGKIKHGLGTHYVRSITYGGELAASLSIKNTSSSEK